MDSQQQPIRALILFGLVTVVFSSTVAAAQSLNLPTAMPAAAQIVIEDPASGPQLLDPDSGVIYLDEVPLPGAVPTVVAPQSKTWTILPEGLIYHSYLAGAKEPRLSTVLFHEREDEFLVDSTIGGRVGLFRYGNTSLDNPEGFQFDLEAAAMPRLDPHEEMDLRSVDFRAGLLGTVGSSHGAATKFGYYHLSSHLGDEFLIKNPDYERLNYSRDALVLGQSFHPITDIRLYGEVAYAFRTRGGAEPWEFQLGVEYSPARVGGAPFIALNGHLREEVDYGGNVVVQTGWQWRGAGAGRLLRTGFHYYNGKSPQFSFFDQSEEQLGVGLWYDF